jgi:hypothetical protein
MSKARENGAHKDDVRSKAVVEKIVLAIAKLSDEQRDEARAHLANAPISPMGRAPCELRVWNYYHHAGCLGFACWKSDSRLTPSPNRRNKIGGAHVAPNFTRTAPAMLLAKRCSTIEASTSRNVIGRWPVASGYRKRSASASSTIWKCRRPRAGNI